MSTLIDNMGLIKKLSRTVWNRLSAFSSDLEYSDLEQEACRIYIKAEEQFNKNSRAKFSTYASDAILNRLNFIADVAIQKAKFEQIACYDDEESVSFEAQVERLISDCEPIEIELSRQDIYEGTANGLTPIASILFRETFTPSDKILKEFRAREQALREQGRARTGYFYMNTVAEFLVRSGISSQAVNRAKREIINLGKT